MPMSTGIFLPVAIAGAGEAAAGNSTAAAGGKQKVAVDATKGKKAVKGGVAA